MSYSHILAAIGSHSEGEVLIGRAMALAQRLGARLSVLHVIEPTPPLAGLVGSTSLSAGIDNLGIADQMAIDDAQLQSARRELEILGARFGLPREELRISVGPDSVEILAAAADAGADLIVVGHHPHRGLSALFRHTEESVVQRARCDVLAVALERP